MTDRVTLKHLRSFAAVAETGSFTLAAARLCVTQSALTAVIQQFEEAVGQRMFDRSTRRVSLTRQAEQFLPEALRVLHSFDNAVGDLMALSSGRSGQIRIAAAASVIRHFLARSLEEFRLGYPDISITLRDAAAREVERLVIEGEVDFGIESSYQPSESLQYVPLVNDRYGVVCRRDLPVAALQAPLRWADLPAAGYVSFSADTGIGHFLRRHAAHWPVLRQAHDEVSSTTSLFTLLGAGSRYSVVPAMAFRETEFPELVFRELVDPPLSREICLITRRLRSLSSNAERLLKVVVSNLHQARLPAGAEVVVGPAR
ncbi:LysR family transcriptional regulator [Ramlibacter tataouinensis]|uniref:Transcriptional regulator, LysR family-like protein n=1 Tax=Ramlibacter tataouinensis (strain ATCC BAA-407 / DSM 14655 / LMG 21543 / TTB310) TaxID=365046 RepID=F5Y6G2_RAMTT|nr:LysR substrate-binding domain-containing protein [Ramlibacter tataouinensis]AEG94036.1 transcriptional regulator, LysR family-like protein [Ramlibacter tataouinensis TTB310]